MKLSRYLKHLLYHAQVEREIEDKGFDHGYTAAQATIYSRLASRTVDWPQMLQLLAGSEEQRAKAAACIATGRYIHELDIARLEFNSEDTPG